MSVSRRDFNRLALTGLAGLSAVGSGRALASVSASDRKFLFVFARGGWDYSYVFAPLFDNSFCDTDPSSAPATAGSLAYVDSPNRPAVRAFMDAYADRTCIVNGYEIASVTHPRCTQIMLTGKAGAIRDDFPSILAANSPANLLMPYAVLSGPAYTANAASAVVRVGSGQQLPGLLDGSILVAGERRYEAPSTGADALLDAFVEQRASAYADAAGRGRERRYAETFERVNAQIRDVYAMGDPASLFNPGASEISTAVDLLALGVSRCVLLQDEGLYDMSWDTHASNSDQNFHFELLFQKLSAILAEIDATTSVTGNPLSEEVTVVVLSEMGRDPRLNASNGKHHWTWTSAMLVGGGITGGRVVGGYNEFVTGAKVDHASGELSESGTTLTASDLGATLLALGGLDPTEFLPEGDPIVGILT
jgi:uncharacterized protein (DUF1501 family)